MRKNGFSVWEEIIVLITIAIMVNVVYYRYKLIEKKALKSELATELSNIRLAVQLYKIKNGRYPKNLYELYKKGYLYYNGFRLNRKKGEILDKLGNRYIYDNKTGHVYINPRTLKEIQ